MVWTNNAWSSYQTNATVDQANMVGISSNGKYMVAASGGDSPNTGAWYYHNDC